MKIHHYAWSALVALMLAAPTQAAENPVYFGFKAGTMDPQAGGHKDALNVGALIGFQIFDDARGTGSIEAEGTTTLTKGDIDGGGNWDVDTLAAYFAYRTAGDVFLKLKGGFANQKIGGTSEVPEGTSFSAGVGVGWHATKKAGVEAEFTALDHLRYFSIGVFTSF